MKKRIITILMLLCTVLTIFTGCFESTEPDDNDNNFTEVSDEEWKSWLSGSKIENVDNYTIVMKQSGGSHWGEDGYLYLECKYDATGNGRMKASVTECVYNSEKEDYVSTTSSYDGNVPTELVDSVEDLRETIKNYLEAKSVFTYDKNSGYYEMSTMGLVVKLGFSEDGFTFYMDMGTGTVMTLVLKDINKTVF